MDAEVKFIGDTRIRAQAKDLVVECGLPPALGGDPGAYGPFDMVLCGLAVCTSSMVRDLLRERGFLNEAAGMRIHATQNEKTHLLEDVTIEILVPKDFPEKYESAIIRAAGTCPIKHQLGLKPEIKVVR